MVSVLNEINEKLGNNAGDKAASVFGTPPNKEPKEEKDSFKKESYSDLVRGFKDALNSVPIFQKLTTTLTGLSPLIRDLVTGGGFAAAHKILEPTMKDFLARRKEILEALGYPKSATGLTAMIRLGPEKVNELREEFTKLNKILHGVDFDSYLGGKSSWPQGQERKETWGEKGKRISGWDDFKKGLNFFGDELSKLVGNIKKADFPTVFKNLGKPILDFYKDVLKFGLSGGAAPKMGDTFKKLFGGMGGGFGGLGAALGGLGGGMSSFGTMALTLIGMIKLPLLIFSVGAALLKLAKSIADSQRAIAQYSGLMAVTFAIHDIKQMFRDMKEAAATAPATAKFYKAWDEMANEFLPVKIKIINGLLELGTVLAQVAKDLIPLADAIVTATKWILEHIPGAVKTLSDIGAKIDAIPMEAAAEATKQIFGTDENGSAKSPSWMDYIPQHGEKGWYWGENASKRAMKDAEDAIDERKNVKWHVGNDFWGNIVWDEDIDAYRAKREAERSGKLQKKIDAIATPDPTLAKKIKDAEDKKKLDDAQKARKAAEDEKKRMESNQFANTMGAVKKAADEAFAYYHEGVMGAGEFMLGAATWNYDPEKRRPSEHNKGLWDAGVALKRHGAI